MKLVRLTLFSSFMLAATAPAQDGSETATNRTPAGAQQFITRMRPPVMFVGRSHYIVMGASSSEACKTEFVGTTATFSDSAFHPDSGAPQQPFVLDWSTVEDITTDEDNDGGAKFYLASMRTPQGAYPGGVHLWFSVALTRDRVVAAAQYLRGACDKNKDSGF